MLYYVAMYFANGENEITEFNDLKSAEKYIKNYDDLFDYVEILTGITIKRLFYNEV